MPGRFELALRDGLVMRVEVSEGTMRTREGRKNCFHAKKTCSLGCSCERDFASERDFISEVSDPASELTKYLLDFRNISVCVNGSGPGTAVVEFWDVTPLGSRDDLLATPQGDAWVVEMTGVACVKTLVMCHEDGSRR